MSNDRSKSIVVLGASGLIGHFVATDLARRGFAVTAVARRFTPGQREAFGTSARELPVIDLAPAALTNLLVDSRADVVVNCLGVLQDGIADRTQDVHDEFVARLLKAIRAGRHAILLIHISIPGGAGDDNTQFSRTKRNAEQRIIASDIRYAILRPGFVWAPAAFGGSALFRALAASPFRLSAPDSSRPFRAVAVEDVAETVAWLTERGPASTAVTWDLMEPKVRTVGEVIASLRRWFGTEACWQVTVPGFLLVLAAKAGDVVAWLGWRSPVRSTALQEMRRGVDGDPGFWMAATEIVPQTLDDVLRTRPATVQERWFARLYGLKPLAIVVLVVFWCVSGLIAITISYPAAVAIMTSHGYSDGFARATTVASSVLDIFVGLLVAVRRTCRLGLFAGVAMSLGYMTAAAGLMPDLWTEPLGALVKTGPAIVLMLMTLAISDER